MQGIGEITAHQAVACALEYIQVRAAGNQDMNTVLIDIKKTLEKIPPVPVFVELIEGAERFFGQQPVQSNP